MIRDTVTNGAVRERTLSRNGITVFGRALAVFLVVSVGLPPLGFGAVAQQVDPKALDALYSLDFDIAEESFRQMTVREPDNPTAWNLLASAIWLEIVYRQEKLSLDSFTGSQLGTDESSELVSAEREAYLREVLDNAIAAAQAMRERNPRDLEALYALGVSYATLASFEALAHKAYFAAHGAAKEARQYHMELLNLDPSFNDARLTIGTYDYAVGVIPRFIRWMLSPFGIRGDKEGGIEQLQYAAELGDRAETNAKVVLIVVYNREKRYDEALELLYDLHASYPRNYLMEMTIGQVYQRMERWDQARETYRSVMRKIETGTDGYDRFESDLEVVHYKLAEASVRSERKDAAIQEFESLSVDPAASEGLRALSHLWLGRLYTEKGAQAQARRHFQAVLELDAPDYAVREARENL